MKLLINDLTNYILIFISGKSKVCVCACVSPLAYDYDESYSTLLFASRAMGIKINPLVNESIYVKVRGVGVGYIVNSILKETKLSPFKNKHIP